MGGGGIACYLAPLLTRMMDVVIIDGDNYEPKNSKRQFPALTSTENKAKTLCEMLSPHTLHKVSYIDCFLKDMLITNRPEWAGVDIIFGAVDNNKSRHIIIELADALEIPAILAGNEDEHGEAHLFVPQTYNPLNHFDFPDTEPAPWSCNSDENLATNTQTPIANFLASGAAAHLLLAWNRVSNPLNAVAYSRTDALSNQSKRVKELLAALV